VLFLYFFPDLGDILSQLTWRKADAPIATGKQKFFFTFSYLYFGMLTRCYDYVFFICCDFEDREYQTFLSNIKRQKTRVETSHTLDK